MARCRACKNVHKKLLMLKNLHCKGLQKKHIHHHNPFGGSKDVSINSGNPGPEYLTMLQMCSNIQMFGINSGKSAGVV